MAEIRRENRQFGRAVCPFYGLSKLNLVDEEKSAIVQRFPIQIYGIQRLVLVLTVRALRRPSSGASGLEQVVHGASAPDRHHPDKMSPVCR